MNHGANFFFYNQSFPSYEIGVCSKGKEGQIMGTTLSQDDKMEFFYNLITYILTTII